MTVVTRSDAPIPKYTALSTDIADNKLSGATSHGDVIYLTDTKTWKIIHEDGTLSDYNTVPLESNGAIPINIQDQHTVPINSLFVRALSNFTLSSDTDISTITDLKYDINVTAGHGIAIGNEILLADVAADESLQAVVINVVTNVITIDKPIDHIFSSAFTIGRIASSEMAVVGSLASPIVFSMRAGAIPADMTMFKLAFLDATDMDDGKFGGMLALTNGLVLRVINNYQSTIFNFKTNLDLKLFGQVDYSSKAPAGQYGMLATLKFAGQSERGVTVRISTGDVIQWVFKTI